MVKSTQNEDRQSITIKAAAKLFGKYGFENTSIRDVAEEAGFLPGSIYYHFPSKNDMLYEVYRLGMAELTEEVKSRLASTSKRDPWLRLEIAARSHVEKIIVKESLAAVTVGNLPVGSDALRSRIIGLRNNYEDIYRQLIAELPVGDDVNRKYLRLAVLGALNFMPVWSKSSSAAAGDQAAQIIRIFKRHMTARRARNRGVERNEHPAIYEPEPIEIEDGLSNRRGDILQAGARQFIKSGYKATTMRDIAAEADMKAGSIYYHFKSKAELLLAILDETSKLTAKVMESACAGLIDPWERLEAVCAAHLYSLVEHSSAYASPIDLQVFPIDDLRLQEKANKIREASEKHTQDVIGDLPLPTETDGRLFFLTLFGAISTTRTWYKAHRDSPAEIAQQIVSILRVES